MRHLVSQGCSWSATGALSFCGLSGREQDLGSGVCKEPHFTNFDSPPLGKEGHRNRKYISLIWVLWAVQRRQIPLGARTLSFGEI